MNTFEWNKIAGAVLGTLVVGMGVGILAEEIFATEAPEESGFAIAETDVTSGGGGEATEQPTFLALLANADVGAGRGISGRCTTCHSLDPSGTPGPIAPNLYGVVGRMVASTNFNYSAGLRAHGDEVWTFEHLHEFIPNTGSFGSLMPPQNTLSDTQLANLIAYLNTQSANPLPLPEAPAGAPSAEPPAEGPAEEPAPVETPVATSDFAERIAVASAERGASAAGLCMGCHSVVQGGPATIVGPNLFGVVGRDIAGLPGASYSPALRNFMPGEVWTPELLDTFLAGPGMLVPGTTMPVSVANPATRADVVAYLESLMPAPPAEPEAVTPPVAEEATPPVEETPAEEITPPAEETAPVAEETPPAEETVPAEVTPALDEPVTPAPDEVAPAPEATTSGETTPETVAATEETAAPEEVPATEAEPETAAAEEPAPAMSEIEQRVAAADPQAGSLAFQSSVCSACHTVTQGGPTIVGPNLFDVVGRDIASVPGATYSQALRDFMPGEVWTVDLLDAWLAGPMTLVPGTTMGIAVASADTRASIIAYLQTLAPVAAQPEPAADAAPAETTPVDTAAAGTPVETTGTEPAPVDTAPAETAPAETAPTETAPADVPPAEPTAAAETPVAETPVADASTTGEPTAPETAAADVPPATEAVTEETPPALSEVEQRVAAADPQAGSLAFQSSFCSACHTATQGGPTIVGPNLFGVVGRDIAGVAGVNYSQALRNFMPGEAWTVDLLDAWLAGPSVLVPGTTMGASVPNADTRASIIAYLRSLMPPPAPAG